ncbi:hypothetical protein SDC9_154396 [bioreactor metagenome]|uniref:Uncharacterized protein n=1 Tax=bioreactor metagenome TaxID=1076179 RepID=A0A645F058_9ZZZZ
MRILASVFSVIFSMYVRCSGGRSARRTAVYAPCVCAFIFPKGAPAPTAFLFPGCPPRFLLDCCFSSKTCHLSKLFHFLTCSGFTPVCSATSFVVSFPSDSIQILQASSRSRLRSLAISPHPLSFVFQFPLWLDPRKGKK